MRKKKVEAEPEVKMGPKPKSDRNPASPWRHLWRAAQMVGLSIEAKGVLLWMFGQRRPVTKEQVQEGCNIGVAKAGRILRDLRSEGFIRFKVVTRKSDGYARWHYELNTPRKQRVKGGLPVDQKTTGERSEGSGAA